MSASGAGRGFTAQLAAQDDPRIGDERIIVRFDDGQVQELRLHDYAQLYALPGVYEEIVTERLGCRSPWEIAAMLADAVDAAGWARGETGVLDLAAGNGVSGEALAGAGLVPVLGTDIVPEARDAVLRDRPGVYQRYLTLDLLALTDAQRAELSALRARALCCVAPVGDHAQQLPVDALAAAAALLAPDALIAYMHDPTFGTPDPVTLGMWLRTLGSGTQAHRLICRRYLHRRTVYGAPFEMDGVVWRVTRGQAQ